MKYNPIKGQSLINRDSLNSGELQHRYRLSHQDISKYINCNSTFHATQRCGLGRVFLFIDYLQFQSLVNSITKQVVAQLGKQLVSYFSDLQERINVEQLVPQFIHISFRQKLAKLLPEKFQLSLPSIGKIEAELGWNNE